MFARFCPADVPIGRTTRQRMWWGVLPAAIRALLRFSSPRTTTTSEFRTAWSIPAPMTTRPASPCCSQRPGISRRRVRVTRCCSPPSTAEELGHHGARALLGSGLVPRASTALNVNLDMVSRNAANEIYAAGPYDSPWQMPILQDCRRVLPSRFCSARSAATSRRRPGGLDPFIRSRRVPYAGVPFVYFGVEDHPDYHRPTDTADRIDPRFFGDAADMVIEAIRAFDAHLK